MEWFELKNDDYKEKTLYFGVKTKHANSSHYFYFMVKF